jgi:hypothetical protein
MVLVQVLADHTDQEYRNDVRENDREQGSG